MKNSHPKSATATTTQSPGDKFPVHYQPNSLSPVSGITTTRRIGRDMGSDDPSRAAFVEAVMRRYKGGRGQG